jgi:hypothetical protein
MATFEHRGAARQSTISAIVIFSIVFCALVGSLVVLLAPPTW